MMIYIRLLVYLILFLAIIAIFCLSLYRKMRHTCRNFAIQSHQPGGGIGQTRFVCRGSGIAGWLRPLSSCLGIVQASLTQLSALRRVEPVPGC